MHTARASGQPLSGACRVAGCGSRNTSCRIGGTHANATPAPSKCIPWHADAARSSRAQVQVSSGDSRRLESGVLTGVVEPSRYLPSNNAVEEFLDAFNRRDYDGMMAQYDDNCVLEDLAYDTPVKGNEAIRQFLQLFIDGLPSDAQFVVDSMTSGDSESVGVMWHLEISGREVPFGKGINFYKVTPQGRIFYVRQCPEHFAKLAFAAPSLLAMAAPLVRMDLGSLVLGAGNPAWARSPAAPAGATRAAGDSSSPRSPSSPASRSATNSQSRIVGASSVESTDPSSPLPVPESAFAMNGKWSKDKERSDLRSYDQALDMMGVTGIQKTTAELIDGLELQVTDTEFTMRFLTIVPYFKVTESYMFNKEQEMGRRDLRSGWQRGVASVLPSDQVKLVVELGPANGWRLTERFSFPEPDRLSVESNVYKDGTEVRFVQMYTRGHS